MSKKKKLRAFTHIYPPTYGKDTQLTAAINFLSLYIQNDYILL